MPNEERIEVQTLLSQLLEARATLEVARLDYENLRDKFLAILDKKFPLEKVVTAKGE